MKGLAGQVFFGNSLAGWAVALLIFLVLLTILPFVRLALVARLHALKPHQSPTALELMIGLVQHTTRPFIVVLSAYVGLKWLTLPAPTDHIIDIVIKVVLWLQIALWGMQAARFAIDRRTRNAAGTQLPTIAILRFLSLVLVWALAVLMLLANLGVNITALVTSLGIGGVAFALAIQNVLGDVLASLAIAWDKPFQIGDELRFDNIIGTVEQIGIKSTRLRSIDGEQIVIGNAQLLQVKLRNFGRAREQRASVVLTLAFETPADTLRGFPALIERVIKTLPAARFDYCYLRGLGAAGIECEVSFFAISPRRVPLKELQQQFTLQLLEQLGASGIGFASPGAPVLAVRPPRPAAPQGAAP
jgi:small-conductance mechanosensitive channel